MKTQVIRIAIFLQAFSPVFLLNAQHQVIGFERVNGIKTFYWDQFAVSPSGHFVNTGKVNFARVTTLTNNGGISEISNGQKQAVYANPCTTNPGTSGLNVFGNEVSLTTINGSAPLRMHGVQLNRNIQLDNEWQIAHSFQFNSGRVTTDRTDTTHFVHFLAGSSTTGTTATKHIHGYAAYSGNGPFTLPIGNGQKLGQIQVMGNCQGPVKAAYFASNPSLATLPVGAPFSTGAIGTGVAMVSSREYWDVNGAEPTQIVLFFDSTSQLSTLASSLSQIVVAGWDGNKWVNLGNSASSGTLSAGSVTSGSFVPNQYQALTFASTCSVILSSAPGTNTQTLCSNTPLVPIEFSTIGATGITGNGIPGANGLPDGVSAVWEMQKITISGTPLQAGTFQFSIPVTGCGGVVASGTITVLPAPDAVVTVLSPAAVLTCTRSVISVRATGGANYLWNNNLGTADSVGITTPGTYMVRVTAANGCRDSAQIAITEEKIVPVGTLTGVPALCVGDSAIFSASVPGGSWSSSNTAVAIVNAAGKVTGIVAGQATIIYTVPGIGVCRDTSIAQTVTVRGIPATGILSGNQEICVGSMSVFVSTVPGGSWSSSDNIVASVHPQTGVVSGLSPGTATIRYAVTSAEGCTAFAIRTVTVTGQPIAGSINGLSALCPGGATVFSASSPGGTWSISTPAIASVDQSGRVTALASGTATVLYTVKGSGGCADASTGLGVIVGDLPIPSITSATGNNILTCSQPSLSLTASGGASYNWSSGLGSSASATVTAPGVYTVTVTGANGCSSSTSIDIAQNISSPVVGIINQSGGTELTCARREINLLANGGTGYAWSGGLGSGAQARVTAAGAYTVTVTGANGCTGTQTITITQNITRPTAAISNLSGGTVLSCNVPSINVVASGGTGYAWSGGLGTNPALTISAPGSYTVTVTGSNDCSATETITISRDTTAPQVAINNLSGGTVLNCSLSAIEVQATGGISYAWSGGLGTSAEARIIAPGTYTVTVTGSNGCRSTQGIVVTQDIAAPTAAISNLSGRTVLTCAAPAINVRASGGTGYAWSGGLGSNAEANITAPGSYTVTVRAANGCTATQTIGISRDTAAPVVAIANLSGSEVLTCTVADIRVQASGGLTYIWSGGLGGSATATIIAPGTYTVTATGENGCRATRSVSITQNIAAPVAVIANQSGSTVLTCQLEAIQVLASGGQRYNWARGLGSASAARITAPGRYTVTVTGENGCTDVAAITVTQDTTAPVARITAPEGTQLTCTRTTLGLLASGGSSYLWGRGLGTTEMVTVALPGAYPVTVTGANGCTASAQIVITVDKTVPNAQIAAVGGEVLTCARTTVTLRASGGMVYSWGNGLGAGEAASVTQPGVYVVTVTGANGCTETARITITEDKTPPMAEILNDSLSRVLGCDRPSVVLRARGGVRYQWGSDLGTADTVRVKDPGTFTVTVTGTNGCSNTASTTVTADSARAKAVITAIENSGKANDNVVCNGETVRLVALGGSTFRWNTGATGSEISVPVTATREFSVVVSKDNGCSDSAQIRIVANPALSISKTVRNTCIGGSTGTVSLQVSGGQPGYTFVWSNGQTGREIENLRAGAYVVTVRDSNLCALTDSVTIRGDTPAPSLGVSAPEALCIGARVFVGLEASQPLLVRYSLGNGAAQSINVGGGGPLSVDLDILNATSVFRVLSAASLATGCEVETAALSRTIEAVSAPALVADNGSSCSDAPFSIPVRFAAGSGRETMYDWTGSYNGLSGGVGSGLGLKVGQDAISERLRNTSTGAVQAVYRITPFINLNNQRCAGQPYVVQVRVQAEAVLDAVAPQEVCSGTALSIPLSSNIPGATISWSRTGSAGTVSGRGNIIDRLENNTGLIQDNTYRVEIASGGCAGPEGTVSVRVRPVPKIVLAASKAACSGFADLTEASITAGSDPGLAFTYWQDRNLGLPVANPGSVPGGLYFIAGRDAFGCSSSGSIRVQSAIRLRVNAPAPVCQGRVADLTLPEITAGSDANLFYTYWEDAAASRVLSTPFAAPAGTYFIKAERPGGTDGCFAILPVEVKEIVPELLNAGESLQVCSGSVFGFQPNMSIAGAVFEWSRESQPGIVEPEEGGSGEIREMLSLSGNSAVVVNYGYRLRAPGCSLLGAKSGSLRVEVLPKPNFTVVEEIEICSPTQDLNLLVGDKSGLEIRFTLDDAGLQAVAMPEMAVPGRYVVRGTSAQGCFSSKSVVVKSRIGVDINKGELVICPPQTANLTAFASGAGLSDKFKVGYFRDIAATQGVSSPTNAGEGTYFLLLEAQGDSLSGCKAIVPVEVKSGLAALNSSLEVAAHCGGTPFTYTPTGTSAGTRFGWSLLGYSNQQPPVGGPSGEGAVSLVLENGTDSTIMARLGIVASSSTCPESVASYVLDVEVLPTPELAPIGDRYVLESGDTLSVGVGLVRPVGIARLDWSAAYGGIEGGAGKGAGVLFGPRAITEQLFNFTDTVATATYTLTPVLTGVKACAGVSRSFTVTVEAEGGQSPAGIAGVVQTNLGAAIEGAELRLSGSSQAVLRTSGNQGRFAFTGIRAGYDYSLTPRLDKDLVNGVTTRDMVALQQHLTGQKPIQDPYRLIAADINNSRSVTVADVVALRKTILGIETGFPSNRSWRFVDADYIFPNPLSPWTPLFPELKNYNDISGEQTGNFIGVKIGDINGDVRANSLQGLAPRSGDALVLTTENPEMRKGERLVLPVRTGGTEDRDGMQFTLSYDLRALRLVVAESHFPIPDNIALFETAGLLTCSWDKPLKPGETVMALHFEVLKDGKPESWIDLNSRITAAEGYIGMETRSLQLHFELQGTENAGPRAMQNFPNPFTGHTTIPFWIPVEDRIWLRVYDLTGKLILQREGIFGRGRHGFDLVAPELREGNTWYYQIGGSDWVETRQMMRF